MNIVILGAGAVGSVLGGLLAVRKHDVLLVCRETHADAIALNGGLRLRSATGDYFAHLRASTTFTASDLPEHVCVFITAKSYDTVRCVEMLSAIAKRDIPVVCFQNGVTNEEIAAEHFDNVYGGVCRMTCSVIQAGQASFRQRGRIIVGKYPKGSDALAKKLAEAFEDAGCQATVSRNIMCDRWLKLAVNTLSTFHAIIDPRDHDSNEFFELKVAILEEARNLLKARKLRPKSCDGKDPSIDEVIAELKRPRAPRASSGMKVRNSTWQNLYLKRPLIENDYFHTPFIELGRSHDIPVPYNEVALELVEKCHADKVGPEALRLSDVLRAIEERKRER
jgi:2-dehydropantoate 2-reductase